MDIVTLGSSGFDTILLGRRVPPDLLFWPSRVFNKSYLRLNPPLQRSRIANLPSFQH